MKHSEAAREMMLMLHKDFGTRNGEGRAYPLDAQDIEYLAKAAAVLLEATAKFVPDNDAAIAAVRISNLETQNDGLRVNNEALRASNRTLAEALEKMANPVREVITNNHINMPGPMIRECPRCGAKPAVFSEGQCQSCGEPSK